MTEARIREMFDGLMEVAAEKLRDKELYELLVKRLGMTQEEVNNDCCITFLDGFFSAEKQKTLTEDAAMQLNKRIRELCEERIRFNGILPQEHLGSELYRTQTIMCAAESDAFPWASAEYGPLFRELSDAPDPLDTILSAWDCFESALQDVNGPLFSMSLGEILEEMAEVRRFNEKENRMGGHNHA